MSKKIDNAAVYFSEHIYILLLIGSLQNHNYHFHVALLLTSVLKLSFLSYLDVLFASKLHSL